MNSRVRYARGAPLPTLTWAALIALVLGTAAHGSPESPTAADLTGVYQSAPSGRVLPGGYQSIGVPAAAQLLPSASAPKKDDSGQLEEDAFKLCQEIGPFRMMAQEGSKIELVPSRGMLVMLFEDISHGYLRTIYLHRTHRHDLKPTLQGDSIGHWDGDTLRIDTTALSDRTWLNDLGAHASNELHLIESIRPIQGGKILEYRLRAEDPKALAQPYSYTRYYERVDSEIHEDLCEIHSHWDCGALCIK